MSRPPGTNGACKRNHDHNLFNHKAPNENNAGLSRNLLFNRSRFHSQHFLAFGKIMLNISHSDFCAMTAIKLRTLAKSALHVPALVLTRGASQLYLR
jgi:hypothetical protein